MRIYNSIRAAYQSIRQYGTRSMYLRNLIIVLLFSMLPMLILIVVSMNTINDFSKSEINKFYQEATNQMRDALDDELFALSGIAQEISSDGSLAFVSRLSDIRPLSQYEVHVNVEYLYAGVNNHLTSNTEIDTVCCYFGQSGTLLTGRHNYGCTISASPDPAYAQMMDDVIATLDRSVDYRFWQDPDQRASYMTVACRAPFNSMNNRNLVLVTLRTAELLSVINAYDHSFLSDVVILEGTTGNIINGTGTAGEAAADEDLMDKIVGEAGSFAASGEERQLMWVYSRSRVSDLVTVSKIDMKTYYDRSIRGRTIFIIAAVVSAFIAAILSVITTSRFGEPIAVLSSIIRKPGEWLEKQDTRQMGFLEVQYVTRNLLATYRRNTQLEDQLVRRIECLRRAQINALQSQINPHFLFNTLESINWSVREELGLKSVSSDLIDSLSTFLRYSLESNEHLVTIEQELAHARAYVDIQLHRYSNRFEVDWRVDPALLQRRVVKITLQPLIENAINHGIREMDEGGRISVLFRRGEDDGIVILVCDNGGGFAPDEMRRLNDRFSQDVDLADIPDRHIGLENVSLRYRLLFGEDTCMRVGKSYELGTYVKIEYQLSQHCVNEE